MPRASSAPRGGAKQVMTGVVKGLSQFGMQAKAGLASEQADIIVEGEVETNPFAGNDARIKWARTTAAITLRDGRTAKIFTQFNVTDKQGSADYNEAVRRSQGEMSKKVAAQINSGDRRLLRKTSNGPQRLIRSPKNFPSLTFVLGSATAPVTATSMGATFPTCAVTVRFSISTGRSIVPTAETCAAFESISDCRKVITPSLKA